MITEKNDTLKCYRNSKQFSIHDFLQSWGVWRQVDLLGSFVSFSTLPLLYHMKTTAVIFLKSHPPPPYHLFLASFVLSCCLLSLALSPSILPPLLLNEIRELYEHLVAILINARHTTDCHSN